MICYDNSGTLCKYSQKENGLIKMHCLGCCREYGCNTAEESKEWMDYPKPDLFEPMKGARNDL